MEGEEEGAHTHMYTPTHAHVRTHAMGSVRSVSGVSGGGGGQCYVGMLLVTLTRRQIEEQNEIDFNGVIKKIKELKRKRMKREKIQRKNDKY